jgi:hypothetical protein
MNYRITEISDSSVVEAGFALENGPSFLLRYISRDDDNDVAVRVFDLVKVKEEQHDVVIRALNQLNRDYRFVRFYLHSSGSVHVACDMYVCTDNVGEMAVEMFTRFRQVIKQAYPILMKVLWG